MLKVIDFIKSNSNWRDLLTNKPYCLTIKDSGDFTILRYSQIDSDFHNEIVKECRGLIIDKDLNPVCVPFFKFGNYGESYADKIDWNTAVVEEKIDGSLIKVWYDKLNNSWVVSTNGSIFASDAPISENNASGTTYSNFYELFMQAARNNDLDIEALNKDYTYMFELVSPYNKIVISYAGVDIYHIGTRDNATFKELEINIGVKKPKIYQCANLDDLIKMAARLPYCEEGYVVKDASYNRIKVKSPAYVSVHHLISGLNDKRLISLLRLNDVEEFLSYFPEYRDNVSEIEKKIENLISYLEETLASQVAGRNFETRKDFAETATKTKFPAFFFQYLDGKTKTPKDWVWSLSDDKIEEALLKF